MESVRRSWSRIEAWLNRHAPRARRDLRRGASADALRRAEDQLGRSLPADVRASYAIHNGAAGERLIAYWELLSLRKMLQTWRMLQEAVGGGRFDTNRVETEGPVRPVWWHEGWVPFVSTPEGNHECLDLVPTRGGRPGQVIAWVHDEGTRRRIAPTFGRWLATFAADLDAGRYVVSKRGRLIRYGEPKPGWEGVYTTTDPDTDV